MKQSLFAALMCSALSLSGKAEEGGIFFSGNDIYSICIADSAMDHQLCRAYVAGAYDLWQELYGNLCTPDFKLSQATDVFVKFLRENPEVRHLTGAALVVRALNSAYPC